MTDSLLEVIAITPEDAIAAERGGATRLEVVRAIDVGGLTPSLHQFQSIREAVDVPLRIMLRTNGGFEISRSELDQLLAEAVDLRHAGADEFVFGFLNGDGSLDLPAINKIISLVAPCPWTLHHAFDHAADAGAAWQAAAALPGIDHVLSGGIRGDLGQGLGTLRQRASWQSDDVRWLAGGGLVLDHVESLRGAGIGAFHIGRSARFDRSWGQPIDIDAVRTWREAIDTVG
ncbi:MAG: copper homeostasis protein CutC [Thermomicrobiales bacterium]